MTNIELQPYIAKWADKYSVPEELIYGVVIAESAGSPCAFRHEENYRWLYHPQNVKPANCSLTSETVLQKSSIGLMQVMGAVYREYGYRGWLTELFCDLDRQVQYGAKHLAKKIKRYGIQSGISAYNAGRPIPSNGAYIAKVLRHAKEYRC